MEIDTFHPQIELNASHKPAQDKTSSLVHTKLAMLVNHAHQDMLPIHTKEFAKEFQNHVLVPRDTAQETDMSVKTAHTGKLVAQISKLVLTEPAN